MNQSDILLLDLKVVAISTDSGGILKKLSVTLL